MLSQVLTSSNSFVYEKQPEEHISIFWHILIATDKVAIYYSITAMLKF